MGWTDSPFLFPSCFHPMTDLFALTQQALAGTDIELVDVQRAPQGLLCVTIDRLDGVRIEDCEQVSRQLSRVFAVEDVDYKRLEVGSPGLDRPLRTRSDFVRFDGARVEVRLRQALNNRKTFNGILRVSQVQAAAQGEQPSAQDASTPAAFALELDGKNGQAEESQVLNFTLADVERAKLDPVLNFKGKKR